MTVGQRIKERRVAIKMSQQELADRLGYANHSTVARVEAGKIDLPQSRLAQFADVLRVTPAFLMGWDQDPEDLGAVAASVLKDPQLLQLVRGYQALDEADRATVAALVSSLAEKKKD